MEELERMQALDSPYPDVRSAITAVRSYFETIKADLDSLGPANDHATVDNACRMSLRDLINYLPLAGLLVRSTHHRNPFEVYGPLSRLAKSLLDPNARLVLSSEWEYSPYIMHVVSLPGFVFLGLPAIESGNPLVLPLAGHELGHSVWRMRNLRTVYLPVVQNAIVDEIQNRRWADHDRLYDIHNPPELTSTLEGSESFTVASRWALAQVQETFCDFFGLRVFGPAYVEAHVYLLTPGTGGMRAPTYPPHTIRLDNLETACTAYGYSIRTELAGSVADDDEPFLLQSEERNHYQLEVADSVLSSLIPDLHSAAEALAQNSAFDPSDQTVDRIADRYELGVPTEQAGSMANILAAGWKCLVENTEIGRVTDGPRRVELLGELVLKSLEVLEVESRTS